MTLKEKVETMLKDAEDVYEAIDKHFENRPSPQRAAIGHARANIKRLSNFINGRPAIPSQGVKGQPAMKELEDIDV